MQRMFPKPGAPQREEMLTIQVKNTMLHLNGQTLRLAAKNGCNSKTPGLHLSAAHVTEAAGQLTAPSPTQGVVARSDLVLLKPDLEREAENQPVRRPLKLTPLELPEEVREAQRQKLQSIQPEAKPASCKLDVAVNEPSARKVRSCVRPRPVNAAVCPSASTEPLKDQQQNGSSRPQLTRCDPIEQNGHRHLEAVVCRGTPAPLRSKPAPPLLSPRLKVRAPRGTEAAHQDPNPLQQESVRRRLRLSRAECLEEDQYNSNTSTGGLCADKGKLAQCVQGQRVDRAPRGQPHAGKGIKEPPSASWECGGVRKSHPEECSQQAAGCTLNPQMAEGGSGDQDPEGANWRLKRKKPLITKHNNAVPLERLQF